MRRATGSTSPTARSGRRGPRHLRRLDPPADIENTARFCLNPDSCATPIRRPATCGTTRCATPVAPDGRRHLRAVDRLLRDRQGPRRRSRGRPPRAASRGADPARFRPAERKRRARRPREVEAKVRKIARRDRQERAAGSGQAGVRAAAALPGRRAHPARGRGAALVLQGSADRGHLARRRQARADQGIDHTVQARPANLGYGADGQRHLPGPSSTPASAPTIPISRIRQRRPSSGTAPSPAPPCSTPARQGLRHPRRRRPRDARRRHHRRRVRA